MIQLLQRMQLKAERNQDNKQALLVHIPPTRSDILHTVDLIEDIGIAYGDNNIRKTIPQTSTIMGKPQPLNQLSDALRLVLAHAGYAEVLNWVLCSHHENFKSMNQVDDKTTAAILANPKTVEFQVCRTSLLPGMLKTLRENHGLVSLPIRIFEVGDVVLKHKLSSTTGGGNPPVKPHSYQPLKKSVPKIVANLQPCMRAQHLG